LANTPTVRIVKLRSPFNGQVFEMVFSPGQVPTLDTMLTAGFERVEDEPKSKKAASADA
jgi:hypothetical protein